MELEEERRSKRERDSQFKEQEMKINHLSGLVSSSEVHESNKVLCMDIRRHYSVMIFDIH